MVGVDLFAHYAQLGDMTILCVLTLFAVWAWWYGEERDRRRARTPRQREEAAPPQDGERAMSIALAPVRRIRPAAGADARRRLTEVLRPVTGGSPLPVA